MTRLLSLPPAAPARAARPPAPRVRPRALRPSFPARVSLAALVTSILVGLALGAYFGSEAVDSHRDRTAQTPPE